MDIAGADKDSEALLKQANEVRQSFLSKKRSLPSPTNNLAPGNNAPKRHRMIGNRRPSTGSFLRQVVGSNNPAPSSSVQNKRVPFSPSAKNSTLLDPSHMSFEDEGNAETNPNLSEQTLNQTEVECADFERCLCEAREMIQQKSDPYAILDKLVNALSENHKACRNSLADVKKDNIARCNKLNSQQVDLENDLIRKISHVHQENSSRIDAVENSLKCNNEGKLLWINFIDPREANNLHLKPRGELMREASNIFARMNIWMDRTGRVITDAFMQRVTIRNGNSFENDLIMGIKFYSSETVQEMRRLITTFVRERYAANDLDSIRYTARDNWSFDIRRLLRVCYEMSRCKLISNVTVKDFGISVSYEKNVEEEIKPFKWLVRCEKDIDELRLEIGDIGSNVPSLNFYNASYFKLNYVERDTERGLIREMEESSRRIESDGGPQQS
jgi:hypothetical protein